VFERLVKLKREELKEVSKVKCSVTFRQAKGE
jgi:hypothetical protein